MFVNLVIIYIFASVLFFLVFKAKNVSSLIQDKFGSNSECASLLNMQFIDNFPLFLTTAEKEYEIMEPHILNDKNMTFVERVEHLLNDDLRYITNENGFFICLCKALHNNVKVDPSLLESL